MIKLFCGILAVAIVACGIVNATESVGIEVRKRNAIGRLGLVNVKVTVKADTAGTAIVSFQALEAGTYVLTYTSGPDRGKTAKAIKVEKPGPVTAKITNRP